MSTKLSLRVKAMEAGTNPHPSVDFTLHFVSTNGQPDSVFRLTDGGLVAVEEFGELTNESIDRPQGF